MRLFRDVIADVVQPSAEAEELAVFVREPMERARRVEELLRHADDALRVRLVAVVAREQGPSAPPTKLCTLLPGKSAEAHVTSSRSLRVVERVPAEGEVVTAPAADAPDHIEQFFAYDHLPVTLQEISRPFCELAKLIVTTLPRNPERTVALRKLLESKDAAVRAKIAK